MMEEKLAWIASAGTGTRRQRNEGGMSASEPEGTNAVRQVRPTSCPDPLQFQRASPGRLVQASRPLGELEC